MSGNAITTSVVNNMMILLSLTQSRNIYYPKAEDIVSPETKMWGMWGGNRKALGFEAILEHEIENFLNISLKQISKSNWLNKTGFKPAVFWWLESIYEDRPLETRIYELLRECSMELKEEEMKKLYEEKMHMLEIL